MPCRELTFDEIEVVGLDGQKYLGHVSFEVWYDDESATVDSIEVLGVAYYDEDGKEYAVGDSAILYQASFERQVEDYIGTLVLGYPKYKYIGGQNHG